MMTKVDPKSEIKGTAASRYAALEPARQPYVDRAREAARLTIPALFPEDGANGSTDFRTTFQSTGARGVNNLAAKLLLALLPSNSPFFRLTVDDFTLTEIAKREGARAEIEEALASIERATQNEIEVEAIRVVAHEGFKQAVVAGNVLLHLLEEGGMRAYRLDHYVVKRTPAGAVVEIVVKEAIQPDAVPDSIKEQIAASGDKVSESPDKTKDIYTHVKLSADGKRWDVYQEIDGIRIPESDGSYPKDKCPWIALRWTRVDGEDYGRGFIEEYIGDLKSLEALTQAIVEGSAAASKVLFLVNPNGTTDQETLAESENGAIVDGNAQDVSVLQVGKFADFRIASDTIAKIDERLSFAFMLNTAIQRNGERVTAEEIRYMAQELDSAQGGLYALMSQEFQLPLVRVLMGRMEKSGRLPKLPKDSVRPAIITGLEALGRGHDLQRLQAFVGDLAQLAQAKPEILARVNEADLITRLATARGIDAKGLIKSDEEMQAEQQQAQQMQQMQMTHDAIQNLGPEVIRQIGNNVSKQA